MQPNKIALVHDKVRSIEIKVTTFLLRCRGMKVGKKVSIGKISCDWPNKLVVGDFCVIQDEVDFRIWHPFNDNCFVKLENTVFIGHSCEFVCSTSITIGSNCLIASKTTFNDTGHEYSKQSLINKQPITTKAIIVEDDVWIGTRCVILQGVTIGKGAVIGAGSVVNKSIPPYEVWAGVPARFIKKRE
jgi:acetyltransferase-like isoleucine patch superfamily enzyme